MTTDQRNFKDQVVLVVGAASGIGRATTQLIASRGGTVVIADLDRAGLASLQTELVLKDSQVKSVDLSNQSSIQAMIASVISDHKQIDALVNTAGMIGFIKGVGKEVATEGITINAFAPAVIRTPFNAGTSEETLKYMLGRIPMGRVGEPEEAAEMLAFMVSTARSFTTGFTFDASGGRATY